jgi:hypothetical protein
MRGARFTRASCGQALTDRLTLKPYWGKPAVRNFRGGGGNVGIIRSPVRATALPDSPITILPPAQQGFSGEGRDGRNIHFSLKDCPGVGSGTTASPNVVSGRFFLTQKVALIYQMSIDISD